MLLVRAKCTIDSIVLIDLLIKKEIPWDMDNQNILHRLIYRKCLIEPLKASLLASDSSEGTISLLSLFITQSRNNSDETAKRHSKVGNIFMCSQTGSSSKTVTFNGISIFWCLFIPLNFWCKIIYPIIFKRLHAYF